MFETFSVVFYQYWMVVKNLGIAPAGPLALVLTDRVFKRRVSRVSLALLSYVGFHPVNREHSDKEKNWA